MGGEGAGVDKNESKSPDSVPQEGSQAAPEGQLGDNRPKAFKIERIREKKRWGLLSRPGVDAAHGTRIDILCIFCAVFGLISLALPWVIDPSHYEGDYRTLWSYAISVEGSGLNTFGVAAGFILVGSLLALFTRLGGLIQMAGLISFLTIHLPSSDSVTVGPFFAVVGCVAGVLSLIMRKSYTIPERFLTLNLPANKDRLEVNVLSILAGSIGLMCVVLPWFRVDWNLSYLPRTDVITLYQFSNQYVGSLLMMVAAIVFIAASVSSLLSPVGAVGQAAAWAAFLYETRGFAGYSASYFGQYSGMSSETSFSIGFYLGLACAVIGLSALFVPWRLRLSKSAVSTFISWPVALAGPKENPATSGDHIHAEVSVRDTLRSAMKALFITVVVLVLVLASAGLAYVLPLSTLEISVYGMRENESIHMEVYLDGDGRQIETISAGTVLIASFSVRAGAHRVGFDYGVVGDENGTQLDGSIDWSTSIEVKPLRKSVLVVALGEPYFRRPVIELSSMPYGNGERINITDINEGLYTAISWDDVRIMLREGSNVSQWQPYASDLDGGTYADHVFPPVALGDLNVTCTIVDLMGDRYVSVGDYLVFTTGSERMFSSTATYTLYLLYEPYSSLSAEFEFHGRF